MTTLLHIDASGKGPLSTTEPLTKYFAQKWNEANPDGNIIYRRLIECELPFVTPDLVNAYYTPEEAQTNEQKKLLAPSDHYVEEIIAADHYLFGLPMYNFTVPAVFKAYIDLIVRGGKTFSYEGGRPHGLLKNKKAYLVTATGGDYSQEPYKSMDFLEPYMRALLNFLGVTDLTFIRAHGTNPEDIAASSAEAIKEINKQFRQVTTAV